MAADGSSTITAADAGSGAAPDPFAADIERAAKSAFAASTKAMDEYQQRLKAEGPKLDARGATMQQLIDTMPARADIALPKGPRDTSAAQPKAPEPDPIQGFGSFASILGIIGSAVLKQPISTALNASAAAMKARNAQDWAAYEAHYREWKDQTDLAFKQAAWEQNHFNDALELMKTDQAAGLAKFSALATLTNNDAARIALESGDPKMMGEYAGSLARLSEAMNTQAIRVQELKVRQDYYDWLKSGGKMGSSLGAMRAHVAQLRAQAEALPPGDPQRVEIEASADRLDKEIGDEQAKSDQPVEQTPAQRTATAAMVASGMPISQAVPGWGKAATAARTQAKNDAIELIKKQNPGIDDAAAGEVYANRQIEYAAGKSSETQLTKMLGATKQAVDQLDFNIDKAKEEMAKLKSSDLSPIINAIARGEAKWTGDPAYSGLFFYMNAVANESARILSGGQASAAQLHVGAMEEAQKWASINMTPASFNEVADSMKAEGAERLRTFNGAIKYQREQRGGGGGVSGGSGAAPPAPDKFTVGTVYTDAKGNKAKYLGGGKWESQ